MGEIKLNVQYTTANRRLAFKANWFQEEAQLTHQFLIFFYLQDNSVEIIDPKTRRTFLKRTTLDTVTQRELYLGSTLSIYGRQFDLVDYADGVTWQALDKYREKTFLLIKNRNMPDMGNILRLLCDVKFNINGATMVRFTKEDAKTFIDLTAADSANMSDFLQELLKGPTVVLELVAERSVQRLHDFLTKDAKDLAADASIPKELIEVFSKPNLRAGCYAAATEEEARKDLDFFFHKGHKGLKTCFRMKDSTLCIIKPHALTEGKSGYIIADILNNGFTILGLQIHHLEHAQCEEFLEIYDTVVMEYTQMVTQLSSGACLAMELGCSDPSRDVHKEFRTLCGPSDPEIGRLLRPDSLRAKYGTTKVMNAIHCTDLPEDTQTEVQYMFQIVMSD